MEKTVNAYDINDFPFSGGIFSPKQGSTYIQMFSQDFLGIKSNSQVISQTVRIGNKLIAKGSRVISRTTYQIRNHTQGYDGIVELIGVQNDEEGPKFFIATSFPLRDGDHISVQYRNVTLHSGSELIH